MPFENQREVSVPGRYRVSSREFEAPLPVSEDVPPYGYGLYLHTDWEEAGIPHGPEMDKGNGDEIRLSADTGRSLEEKFACQEGVDSFYFCNQSNPVGNNFRKSKIMLDILPEPFTLE